MAYFKIIQNNIIISAGCVFLKWREDRQKFYICPDNEGQFVQSFDEKHIYRDSWMKTPPINAGQHENAKVVSISLQQYEDLIAVLKEDEVVHEEIPLLPQEDSVEPPEEEQPMTLAEMRETLIRQQEQIDKLIEKIG